MSLVEQAVESFRAGRLDEAEKVARQVLRSDPTNLHARYCLGLIVQRLGKHPEAVGLFRQAIGSSPENAEFFYNLSLSLSAIGDLAGAESALRDAIRILPELVEAHTNLGAVLTSRGDLNGAVSSFARSVELRPADPLARLNLGKTLRSLDQLDEAEAAFRDAIRLAPALAPAWNMLGSCLREAGRITEAVAAFEKATQLDPQSREAHSNLCYALYFDPTASGERILETHRGWAKKFAAAPASPNQNIDRSPDRRLRIGYVSPNFRSHAVGAFVLPIFEHHDRDNFEIIAYSDTANPDQITQQLQRNATLWRDTRGMPDPALANLIRADRIDILVDLTLHMRGCRLGTFAHRPAPVQLTHLAYCGTSGLSQMDGCVTDVDMLSDTAQPFFTELFLPLPRSYWTYHAPTQTPEPGPLAAQQKGFIRFGSLNSLAKVNDRVLSAWSQILGAVPDSRLALFIPGFESNPSILKRLETCGIPRNRIEPFPRQSLDAYFQTYNQIDIALDPFPYNGGTTTLDALWMGVPIITLEGTLPVGRAGASILKNLGFEKFIAKTEDEYVSIAVGLCADLAKLSALRGKLREKMLASPLLDAPGYVKELEALYRQAWKKWITRS